MSLQVQLWEDSEIDVGSQLWQLLRREDPASVAPLATSDSLPVPETPAADETAGSMTLVTRTKANLGQDGEFQDDVALQPSAYHVLREEDGGWEEITTTTTTTTTVTTVATTTRRPARKLLQ
jgi:hypothetical protein